jgi:hypothetical protein
MHSMGGVVIYNLVRRNGTLALTTIKHLCSFILEMFFLCHCGKTTRLTGMVVLFELHRRISLSANLQSTTQERTSLATKEQLSIRRKISGGGGGSSYQALVRNCLASPIGHG